MNYAFDVGVEKLNNGIKEFLHSLRKETNEERNVEGTTRKFVLSSIFDRNYYPKTSSQTKHKTENE